MRRKDGRSTYFGNPARKAKAKLGDIITYSFIGLLITMEVMIDGC